MILHPFLQGKSLTGLNHQATLGARLFLPAAESRTLGWILHVGKDFPHDLENKLADWGATLIVSRRQNVPSTRGLLEYTDNAFGRAIRCHFLPLSR
jgi:hypothetical protein